MTYAAAGTDTMQDGIRMALEAIGMPDLDVTGEVRFGDPPVWMLWLPGKGVWQPRRGPAGSRDVIAVLGDGIDGLTYGCFREYSYAIHAHGAAPLRGEPFQLQNAGYPNCRGEIWEVRYRRTPEGMAALAADVAAARAWAESLAG